MEHTHKSYICWIAVTHKSGTLVIVKVQFDEILTVAHTQSVVWGTLRQTPEVIAWTPRALIIATLQNSLIVIPKNEHGLDNQVIVLNQIGDEPVVQIKAGNGRIALLIGQQFTTALDLVQENYIPKVILKRENKANSAIGLDHNGMIWIVESDGTMEAINPFTQQISFRKKLDLSDQFLFISHLALTFFLRKNYAIVFSGLENDVYEIRIFDLDNDASLEYTYLFEPTPDRYIDNVEAYGDCIVLTQILKSEASDMNFVNLYFKDLNSGKSRQAKSQKKIASTPKRQSKIISLKSPSATRDVQEKKSDFEVKSQHNFSGTEKYLNTTYEKYESYLHSQNFGLLQESVIEFDHLTSNTRLKDIASAFNSKNLRQLLCAKLENYIILQNAESENASIAFLSDFFQFLQEEFDSVVRIFAVHRKSEKLLYLFLNLCSAGKFQARDNFLNLDRKSQSSYILVHFPDLIQKNTERTLSFFAEFWGIYGHWLFQKMLLRWSPLENSTVLLQYLNILVQRNQKGFDSKTEIDNLMETIRCYLLLNRIPIKEHIWRNQSNNLPNPQAHNLTWSDSQTLDLVSEKACKLDASYRRDILCARLLEIGYFKGYLNILHSLDEDLNESQLKVLICLEDSEVLYRFLVRYKESERSSILSQILGLYHGLCSEYEILREFIGIYGVLCSIFGSHIVFEYIDSSKEYRQDMFRYEVLYEFIRCASST
jgi:hypothetical protein